MKSSKNESVVFDAYAWVEYAVGSAKADVVGDWLERSTEAFTPASVLAELKEWMLRHGVHGSTANQILAYVKGRSVVVSLDSEVAERAGEINFANKKSIDGWGMLDSMVYAVAAVRHAKVLTGDPHFKGLKDVIYIGS